MIYIDCTECIPKNNQKYHGGANYGKRMIGVLSKAGFALTVIIPNSFEIGNDTDNQIFLDKNVNLLRMDNLQAFVSNNENDVLFIPMIKTRRLKIIKNIKRNNKSLKVFVTIHGVRRLDLKPDYCDNYFYPNKVKHIKHLFNIIKYYSMAVIYKQYLKKYIPYYDKVFTVSNDSMQKIIKYSNPKYIKYFYCGSINNEIDSFSFNSNRENYALFVSAGREEKNFFRTFLAFVNYKKHNNNDLKLIVTGISNEKKNNILKNKKINNFDVEANVIFYDYVSCEQLSELYKKCKFVFYLSKSEGFGLPLIEACSYGTPVICSRLTAMPEVLQSSINYVDPYNIESIENGISYVVNTNYDRLIDKVHKRQKTVKESIINSDSDFVDEFI